MRWAIVPLVALMVLSPAFARAGDEPPAGGIDAASTVKSGKSNSDNRAGSGAATDAASSVKSSKSNSDNRTGGGSGSGERGTTVKSGKSNSSD